MTDPNLTEIICVIDRSGSMSAIRHDAIGGFNTFLEQQKKAEGKCNLTYVQFDDEIDVRYDGTRISDIPTLTEETYVPRGMTALLDAVGTTINKVGVRLASTEEEKRPGKVVFVILTDGNENASREFNHKRISDMIKEQRDKYQWEFVFLAANQDAWLVAGSLSINHAANFAHTSKGVGQTFSKMSEGLRTYRTTCDTQALDIGDSLDEVDDVHQDP